jgi:hypothetical protein
MEEKNAQNSLLRGGVGKVIPFRGTKIEANVQNFVPENLAEKKQLGIPFCGTKIEENFRNFVPKHFAEEKML